jgi:O-methyltransferase
MLVLLLLSVACGAFVPHATPPPPESMKTLKQDLFLPMSAALMAYSIRIGRAGTDPHLRMIEDMVAADSLSFMNSAKEETKFLQLLCKLIRCRTAIEVGVYLGYTTLALAQAMPEDGRVIGLETEKSFIERAETVWNQVCVCEAFVNTTLTHIQKTSHRHKIEIMLGDGAKSLVTLKSTLANRYSKCLQFQISFLIVVVVIASVDLIYVDADKTNYPTYFHHSLPLVRVGGLLILDNTLLQGLVIDGDDGRRWMPVNIPMVQGIESVNELVLGLDPEEWEIVNLPFGDGVTICLRLK